MLRQLNELVLLNVLPALAVSYGIGFFFFFFEICPFKGLFIYRKTFVYKARSLRHSRAGKLFTLQNWFSLGVRADQLWCPRRSNPTDRDPPTGNANYHHISPNGIQHSLRDALLLECWWISQYDLEVSTGHYSGHAASDRLYPFWDFFSFVQWFGYFYSIKALATALRQRAGI